MSKIFWLSRHSLNNGQKRVILEKFGNSSIVHENIVFGENPTQQLLELGISVHDVVLGVFPNPIFCKLLNSNFKLGSFSNIPSQRVKGLFACKDLTLYELDKITGNIDMEVIPCPLSLEEQELSVLNPIERQ